ncbi:MAG: NUDIX hydrolase [Bacillota bacterium]
MRVLSYMIEAHIIRQIGKEIEFLLLKRAESEIYPNIWQMVTGSISQDEKTYVTAYREIIEETGMKPEKLWIVPYVNSFYSWRRNHICMVPVFVAQVDSKSKVIISNEHSEFQWVDKSTANKLLAWQGQRNSVEIIYEHFTNQNSQLNFEEIRTNKIVLDQIKK